MTRRMPWDEPSRLAFYGVDPDEHLSKSEQTARTIELIEAVQGNAGVGLTRGDVDDIVAIVRSDYPALGRIADVLRPTWRIDEGRGRQNATIEAAATIRDAVRAYDAKHNGRAGSGRERDGEQ